MICEKWSIGEYPSQNGWACSYVNKRGERVCVFSNDRATAIGEAINYLFTGAYAYAETTVLVDGFTPDLCRRS